MKLLNFHKRTSIIIAIILILIMCTTAYADTYEFSQLFVGSGSVMLLVDFDSGKIVDVNQSAQDYYGYTKDQLLSMEIQDINLLSHEEIKSEFYLAEKEKRNYFIFKHKLASGEIRDVEIYSYPFTKNGQNMVYSVVHDITDKVALQNALEKRNHSMAILGLTFFAVQSIIIFLLWKSLREKKLIQSQLVKNKEVYQSLFDNMGEGFALHEIITDKDGNPIDYRYIDVNDAFKQLTGLKDVEGKTVLEILPGTEAMWIDRYGRVALTGETMRFESYSEQMGRHYSVVAFSPAKNQFATIFFDITERVEIESVLKAEKEKLRTTLLSVGDGVIVTDSKGRVEFINDAAEEITGKSKEQVKGEKFIELFRILEDKDSGIERYPVRDVLKNGEAIDLTMNSCLNLENEECIPITISASPIIDFYGSIEGVVLIFRDDREENKRREEIEYMSYHDFLTDLYNRRYFEEETTRLDTKRNLPLSIIYADVNGLKKANDEFGHEQGDRLLTETAKALKECCRADDIIARVGGDEFAILLPRASYEMAGCLVERIRKTIKKVETPIGPLSVAIGWETKTQESQSLSEILRLSENHMYKRKIEEKGKSRDKI